jgi:hypothetical protein
MQLLVATNCSARKTADPEAHLRARSLPRGTLSSLAHEWRVRCSNATGLVAARRLYAGRGFAIACDVAKSTGAQLRVVSAGMGLVHPETAIPPYSLTLSAGTRDCIFSRANTDEVFSSQQWWQAIRSSMEGARPFERLLNAYPKAMLLLALTWPYLEMIVGELAALREISLRRLRIVGFTRAQVLPEVLRPCVLPYDSRLNDVDKELRGTAFDFPTRALAHFADLTKSDKRIQDASAHARRVRLSLKHWSAPDFTGRTRIDDDTLRRNIRQLKSQNFSRWAALRHLREELELACEQSRFMAAWGDS